MLCVFFFFQAEDGIRDLVRSRGLGDVYKRQELAKLPPNMRTKMDCPRQRSEVQVELDMDGKPLYLSLIHI